MVAVPIDLFMKHPPRVRALALQQIAALRERLAALAALYEANQGRGGPAPTLEHHRFRRRMDRSILHELDDPIVREQVGALRAEYVAMQRRWAAAIRDVA